MNKFLALTVISTFALGLASNASAQPTSNSPMAGEINREAIKAKIQERMQQKFTEVDTNKDGKVSAEEQAADAQRRFITRDTNKDGFLSKDEITGHWKQHKQVENAPN